MTEDDIASVYIGMTDQFSGTVDERTELVRFVYSMMENFVDRAFGLDAVQQILGEPTRSTVEISNAFGPVTHPRRNRNGRARARFGGRRANSNRRTIKGGETKCRKRA